MKYWGIEGFRPHWLSGYLALAGAHGPRLTTLVGRPLNRVWLLWDRTDDEWFAEAPVLWDFGGEQVEVSHRKFDELSLTWNTIDPVTRNTWLEGSGEPGDHTFDLCWRNDAVADLVRLECQRLTAVEFLEWVGADFTRGADFASGMVAVSFVFAEDRVTISNGLDENALEFGPPAREYRTHRITVP